MFKVSGFCQSVLGRSAKTALVVSVACALSILSGCGIFANRPPSNVAQGKLYRSGDPQYDVYFAGLHSLQVELAQAPDRERQIRRSLAIALNTNAKASTEAVGKAVRSAAQHLAQRGTGLNVKASESVENTEQAQIEVEAVGVPIDPAGEKLIATIEKDGTEALKLYVVMQQRERLLEQLRDVTRTLREQADQRFRKSTKAEVNKNLEDAETLIPIMISRAGEVANSAKVLFQTIVESAHTDDGRFKPPPTPPSEKPPPVEEQQPAKKDEKKGTPQAPAKAAPAAEKPDPAQRQQPADSER